MIQILREKTKNSEQGILSYEEYIGTVLYHPTEGYYMKEKPKLGKSGDFYTSMHIHDVFAKMFARTFQAFFASSGLPAVVCEAGGGDGRFAADFLSAWEELCSSPITYILIEASPYHRRLQKEQLKHRTNVYVYESLGDAKKDWPTFNGVFFSNELFDALPVHVVQKIDNELVEVGVTFEGEELAEVFIPCQHEEIIDWLNTYCIDLAEGQRIEVPLVMTDVIADYAAWFGQALMFTIDYGYTQDEWKHPARRDGSLRGYYEHKLFSNVLKAPGEMDITTHIHLDAFVQIGKLNKLELSASMKQAEFLLRAGILDELQEHQDPNPFSEVNRKNRAIRSFIMGEGLGSAFQVMIQRKGLAEFDLAAILKPL